jgi:hypothetical protein
MAAITLVAKLTLSCLIHENVRRMPSAIGALTGGYRAAGLSPIHIGVDIAYCKLAEPTRWHIRLCEAFEMSK